MPEVILIAQTGRTTGSSSSRRLRAEGQIPAVLYGHGMASLSISVDRRDLRHALTGPSGVNALVNLEVDGVTHPTIVKSLLMTPRKTVVQFPVGPKVGSAPRRGKPPAHHRHPLICWR